jgi:hypothetical protein
MATLRNPLEVFEADQYGVFQRARVELSSGNTLYFFASA